MIKFTLGQTIMKTTGEIRGRTFKKSNCSQGSPSGMRCVWVSVSKRDIQVTNVDVPNSPILTFTPDEWDAFVAGVKSGEFDSSK